MCHRLTQQLGLPFVTDVLIVACFRHICPSEASKVSMRAASAPAPVSAAAIAIMVTVLLLYHNSPIHPVVFQQHTDEIRAIRDRDPNNYPQQRVQLIRYPLSQLGPASLGALRF